MNPWEEDDCPTAAMKTTALLAIGIFVLSLWFLWPHTPIPTLIRSIVASCCARCETPTADIGASTPLPAAAASLDPATGAAQTTITSVVVPFLVIQAPEWSVLRNLVSEFRQANHVTLENLSKTLEMAILVEGKNKRGRARSRVLYSTYIQRRIDRLSKLFEEQELVLDKYIIVPFSSTLTLPPSTSSSSFSTFFGATNSANQDQDQDDDNIFSVPWSSTNPTLPLTMVRAKTGTAYQNASSLTPIIPGNAKKQWNNTKWGASSSSPIEMGAAPASYDSAAQVVAHLVRDWSEWGTPVRQSLYHWCRLVLQEYQPKNANPLHNKQSSILVPGAGLGRLAWELAVLDGHNVQALEVSLGMAAAASFVFHQQKQVKLYPYVHDGFRNQVDSEDRYQSVLVPDVSHKELFSKRAMDDRSGTLSYTVASFEALPLLPETKASFDVVVTCFFLDTATNLYQYLDIMHYILKDNGKALWINVGPLQWHANALLPGIAANELRELLEQDYDILYWSVDNEPLEYRNPSTRPTTNQERRSSTAFNGYCPLRFVMRKKRPWSLW